MQSKFLAIIIFALAASAAIACRGGGGKATGSQVYLNPPDVTGLPVLWLGESYDSDGDGKGDMPLVFANWSTTEATQFHAANRWFSLAYGICTPPTPRPDQEEQPVCAVPITIDIYGVCNAPTLAAGARRGIQQVRGVDAVEREPGGLWVQTDSFSINVGVAFGKDDAENQALVKKVVEDLLPANPEAAAFGKGVAFRARNEAAVRLQCAQPGLDATAIP